MFRLLREKRNNIKYSKVQNVTGIQADCDNGCMSDDQVFAELIKKIQTEREAG